MMDCEGGVAAATLTPAGYSGRIAEANAVRVLRTARALLVEGPKGCGKTWFAKRFARSEVLLEQDPAAFALAQAEPNRVLDGATPRLIDEWQRVPQLWGAVRVAFSVREPPAGAAWLRGYSPV